MSHQARESCCLKPIAPHELGQVGLQKFPSPTLHRFVPGLVLRPVALHELSVDSRFIPRLIIQSGASELDRILAKVGRADFTEEIVNINHGLRRYTCDVDRLTLQLLVAPEKHEMKPLLQRDMGLRKETPRPNRLVAFVARALTILAPPPKAILDRISGNPIAGHSTARTVHIPLIANHVLS